MLPEFRLLLALIWLVGLVMLGLAGFAVGPRLGAFLVGTALILSAFIFSKR